MGELMSALDALAAEDLFALTGRENLDRSTLLAVVINRAQAEFARSVRHAEVTQACEEDGMKTMRSWLRGHCRLSDAEASRVVARGRAAAQLPAVAAAFADGMLSAEQVTVAAAVAKPEHVTAAAAQNVDVAEIDAALVQVAATRPYADLGRVVQHYLARLNPDGIEPDPTDNRLLSLHTWSDGTVTGRLQLDAVGGEKVQAALESLVQADRPKGDRRTRPQQLADALVRLADLALASGQLPICRTVKPHVFLTIGGADFFDPAVGQGAARLGFGSWLSAAQARMLACDGEITPVYLNPDGVPLDMGRTRRVCPPHIRRAVEIRDGHCVFAGCSAPSYWCDVHHVLEWERDHGDTSVENSGLLCERHHTTCHHGFRIERDAQGRWHTYRPDGTEIIAPLRL